MLKKLLASALAVATVATCAYVPSALASAATTDIVTATKAGYDGYKLLNPDGPSAETKTTATLSFIVDNQSVAGTVTTEEFVKANESADYIKENLADLVKGAIGETVIPAGKLDGTTYTANDVLTRAKVAAVYDTGAQYLVLVTTEQQIEVSIDENATYVASEDADVLAESNVSVLGWYATSTVKNSADTLKAAAANAGLATKIASKTFDSWNAPSGGIVTAHYVAIVSTAADKYHPTGYTAVTYVRAAAGKVVISKANMLNGGYLATDAVRPLEGKTTVYVPTDDSANWVTYLENYLTLTAAAKDEYWKNITNYAIGDGKEWVEANKETYVPAGLKLIKKDSTQYAVVVYDVKDNTTSETADTITYTLNFTGTSLPASVVAQLSKAVETTNFTTDADEIYSILKKAELAGATKDTLAEYVAQDNDETVTYAIDSVTVSKVQKNTPADNHDLGSVEVTVKIAKKAAYTVYYYDADGVISKATVFLTDDQYTKAVEGTITADVLGVDKTVTIGGVEAKFKSAKYIAKSDGVEVTYELGEATVDINDFETATGLFNDTAYFGKKGAAAGKDVMLKVALSAKGTAKGLDLSKVTVEYQVIGGAVNTEKGQKIWTPTDENDTRPTGVATYITLGEGTNIVVAVVSYNNVVVGTFDPFYTYVG
jgi:hypothetical protein